MLDTHLPELDQGNRRYSDLCAAGSYAMLFQPPSQLPSQLFLLI